MTKAEFNSEFKALLASFPTFRRPDELTNQDMLSTWFGELCVFDKSTLHRAIATYTVSNQIYFPTLPEIKGLCLDSRQPSAKPALRWVYPYPRREHECHPEVEKMRRQLSAWNAAGRRGDPPGMSLARALLNCVSQYEALHARCPGEFRPWCMLCGREQEPWDNITITWLIEKYPQQTKGWNPQHKGALLCDDCSEKYGHSS